MAEIELFTSPESVTANDPSSSSSPSTLNYGGRAIDRHNPIIKDFQRRADLASSPSSPSSSSYLPDNHRRRWHPHRHLHFFSKKKESHFLKTNVHGSTRFLLGSDLDLNPPPPYTDSPAPPPPPVSSSEQVVVLSVSLHCKGCEGKLRKHISKMDGVSSFNIDFEEKKVTVVGDVTPLSVLASISKVKKAQIWAPMAVMPPPQST